MKTIFITGGSGKVGNQLVHHFLKEGHTVITTTRNLTSCEAKFPLQNDKLYIIESDFTKENAVEEIVAFLAGKKLEPECIIHNARSLNYLKIEKDNSVLRQNFIGELTINVVFPYELSLALIKHSSCLRNVIFVSSIYGVVGPSPHLYENFPQSSPVNYGVSKAAQIHLTKELAVRLAPSIRVNCVSFGGIKGRTDESFLDRYKRLNPLSKMLEEEDVIGPVDFLVSDKSENMTGQNLIIDGGWTIW